MTLGIDIGGHSVKWGTVQGGKLIKRQAVPTPKLKKELIELLRTIIENHPGKRIGIAVPGILVGSKVIFSPNLPLKDVNLGTELRMKGKILRFGNDADCAALAEYKARKVKNMVCLTLGSGVGAGIISGGNLIPGSELGHMTIDWNGKHADCCNNQGCVESLLRGPLISVSRKQKEMFGRYLGVALANITNMTHPELIVLAGQKRLAYPLFRKTMEEELKKRAVYPVKVEISRVRHPGIVGASML